MSIHGLISKLSLMAKRKGSRLYLLTFSDLINAHSSIDATEHVAKMMGGAFIRGSAPNALVASRAEQHSHQ
jgi:hypothetical protein